MIVKTVRVQFDVLVSFDKMEMLPTADKILKREVDGLQLTVSSWTENGKCDLTLQQSSKKITDIEVKDENS